MIRVAPQPEPAGFDENVRKRGSRFLNRSKAPTNKEFASHDYWTWASDSLYTSYNAICAYCCHWIPRDTGAPNVEHFRPKSKHPHLAYEWQNFRLAARLFNTKKGTAEDVLDPFEIEDGWFVLNFPSLLVKPAPKLDTAVRDAVQSTIQRLGLNDEPPVQGRLNWLKQYCTECKPETRMGFLDRHAPFIAVELRRQGMEQKICEIMVFPPCNT